MAELTTDSKKSGIVNFIQDCFNLTRWIGESPSDHYIYTVYIIHFLNYLLYIYRDVLSALGLVKK